MKRKTKVRRCKGCNAPEQMDRSGLYTTIAPFLGYCVDCINRANEAQRVEAENRIDDLYKKRNARGVS